MVRIGQWTFYGEQWNFVYAEKAKENQKEDTQLFSIVRNLRNFQSAYYSIKYIEISL